MLTEEAQRIHALARAGAAERVARGAALLDEVEPGWLERIDLHALDLSEPDMCVLGQVYSNSRPVPRWQFDGHETRQEAVAFLRDLYATWSDRRIDEYVDQSICTANYDLGLTVLGIKAATTGLDHTEDVTPEHFGFEMDTLYADDMRIHITYSVLDQAWRELIEERKS